WLHDQVRCSLLEAAENFLDAFHTHFVHAGWIRQDARRQRVMAEVRAIDDGVEARYSEEGKQAGLLSRLLESSRGESFGRFRLPGVGDRAGCDPPWSAAGLVQAVAAAAAFGGGAETGQAHA